MARSRTPRAAGRSKGRGGGKGHSRGRARARDQNRVGRGRGGRRGGKGNGKAEAKRDAAREAEERKAFQLPPPAGQLEVSWSGAQVRAVAKKRVRKRQLKAKARPKAKATSKRAAKAKAKSQQSVDQEEVRSDGDGEQLAAAARSSSSSSSSSSASSSRLFEPPPSQHVLEYEDENEDGAVSMRPEQPQSTAPDGIGAFPVTVTSTLTEMFQHHVRNVKRLQSCFGSKCVNNLISNLNKMRVASLYSGIGGAELSVGLIHKALSLTMPPEKVPDHPIPVLACEMDVCCQRVLQAHQVPPISIIGNLSKFVSKDAYKAMTDACTDAQTQFGTLVGKKKGQKSSSISNDAIHKAACNLLRKLQYIIKDYGGVNEVVYDTFNRKVVLSSMFEQEQEVISMLMAGSTCKSWSSIGKMKGFFGDHTVQFSIMIAVIRHMQPTLMIHECTRNFAYSVLPELLEDYTLHHRFLRPQEHGIPASRCRSYALLVRRSHDLCMDISAFARLITLTDADCGAFCIASVDEVKEMKLSTSATSCRSLNDPWDSLLCPSASSNLITFRHMIQDGTIEKRPGKEMAVLLDQDVTFQTHAGEHLPCILASTTTMWVMDRARPMTPKELMTSQMVPCYKSTSEMAGFSETWVDFDKCNVSPTAIKRMAGNTFNLACSTAICTFALATLVKRD